MTEVEVKKPIIAARETGPGPGRYKLPSTCGFQSHDFTKRMNPSYSFGQRLENSMFSKDCSPGPGYLVHPKLTRSGMDGTPQYSMLGRHEGSGQFRTPAPGAYSPEKSHPVNERKAPAYSLSSRTRYRKRDTVPAPNSYSLPSLAGPKIPSKSASAAYSMTGRPNVGRFDEDLSKTPGPGKYAIVDPNTIKRKAPGYSCLGRSYMPGDATQIPGPGAHRPENVTVTKRRAPAASLGIRHSEFITPLIVDVAD